MSKREPKVSLTFEEKVKAAYLYHYKGIEQHVIAEIVFDGINQGRVNEACTVVERALKEE
jgi:hypothetical protein